MCGINCPVVFSVYLGNASGSRCAWYTALSAVYRGVGILELLAYCWLKMINCLPIRGTLQSSLINVARPKVNHVSSPDLICNFVMTGLHSRMHAHCRLCYVSELNRKYARMGVLLTISGNLNEAESELTVSTTCTWLFRSINVK